MERFAMQISSSAKGSRSPKNTPGWNEYVKPFHEEAKFWWSLWISSGKPNDPNDSIFVNMRSSKSQYKYAIRRLKKPTEEVQNSNFINSILNGSGSIFREIKKFRGIPKVVSNSIDEIIGSENIANRFANKYCELIIGVQLVINSKI